MRRKCCILKDDNYWQRLWYKHINIKDDLEDNSNDGVCTNEKDKIGNDKIKEDSSEVSKDSGSIFILLNYF